MSTNVGTITYGNLTILSGYDTVSSGYGDLIVAGTSLFAGSSATVSGILNVSGATHLSSSLSVTGLSVLTNTTDAQDGSSGALTIAGGVGISKSAYIGTSANVGTTLTVGSDITSTNGVISTGNTTTSTSVTTGALVISGGTGITENLNVGGLVKLSNTTVSTSVSSGAVVISGGLGIGKQLYIGGIGTVSNTTSSTSYTTGCFVTAGGVGISENLNVHQNANIGGDVTISGNLISSGGSMNFTDTTDSTAFSNGALIIAGGVGIAKNLNVGGNIGGDIAKTLTIGSGLFTNTTDSVSITTGSLQTAGGLGVSKNAFIGGFLDVASTASTASNIGSVSIVTSANSANWIQSSDLSRTTSNWTSLKFAPFGNTTTSIMSINATNVTIDKTTASTSSITGSFVVAGGVGIAGDVFIGGKSNFGDIAKFNNDVWLTGNNLYLGTYNSQTDGLVYSATASAGGPFLFGLLGGALGTTSDGTTVALTWDTNQSVQVLGTTDTSSSTTGALTVAGGAGFAKSISVGGAINVQSTSWTSTGNNVFLNANSSTISIRNAAGSASGEFSSSTLLFNFKTIDVTTPIPISQYVTFSIDKTTGYVMVYNTDDSTATATGSFQVSGGASIAKSIYVGLDAVINGGLTVNGTLTLSSTGFSDTTDSVSTTTGSIVCAGGVGIAKNLFVGGSGNFVNTTDSSSSSTGSVIISGGIGVASSAYIGASLNVGNSLTVNGDITSTTGVLNIPNTTSSTSSSTGAIIVGGGVGIGQNLNVAGISKISNTTTSTTPSNGAFVVSGGAGIGGTLFVGGVVSITNTTNATSTSTGSFVTAGGVGIAKDVFIGGKTNFADIAIHSSDLWMNGNNIYLRTYNALSDGLVYSATASTGGPFLFGLNGGALGTTVNTTEVSLTWDSNQSVQVLGTTDTSSSTTGALTVVGGAGFAKSISVGGAINLQSTSWTSTGSNVFINANTATITLRNAAGSSAGEFASTTTFFNFKTIDTVPYIALSVDKTLGYVLVNNTVDATAAATGALQVAGGASISKSLYVGLDAIVNGDLTVNGQLTLANSMFNDTTDSTSTTTGAVTIAGGVGIAKSLYVGGVVVIVNTTDSSSPTTGAFTVAGGVGISASAYIGQNLNVGSTLTVATDITSTNGIISTGSTASSTSTTTGAAIIAGGVGIGQNLNVGGTISFSNTTASTSPSSGALVVSGGTGIGGALNVAGVQTITNTTSSTDSSSGSLVTAGGVGIGENLNVHGNTIIGGDLTVSGSISSSGGAVHFTNTDDSTSPSTGSLILDGGLGVAKKVFIGSTTNSTSVGSGAAVVFGGLGVAKDFYLGGSQFLTGTNPLLTFGTANGLSAPTFTSRSVGTKFLLNDTLSGTTVDYAIGTETNALWNSIPSNADNTLSFKWYAGTTQLLKLDSLGTTTLAGTIDSTSTSSGSLQTLGGAGIAKSLFVGGALNVALNSTLTGAVTASSNLSVAGLLHVTNNTDSTLSSNGSIYTSGGVGVALSVNIGGTLTTGSDTTVGGNLTVTGTSAFNNTTDSSDISTGAAVYAGGVGIAKNLNVGGSVVIAGSTTIGGNLYVNGTRTEVNTSVITTKDNIILVNSAPAGTATSGFALKRYQYANDLALGDIVNNDTPEITGTCQAGSTSTTVVLATSASPVDGLYNGAWILLNSGTGQDEVRRINTYIGATRTATIYTTSDQASLAPTPVEGLNWTTIPDATSGYAIFTSQYIISVFDEANHEYELGSTAVNPVSSPNAPVRNWITFRTGSGIFSGSINVDTINEFTTDAGVTVEGVIIKDGNISGVGTINGTAVETTASVALIDNDAGATVNIPGAVDYGAYSVMVRDFNNTGSSAVFFMTGSTTRGGSVMRAVATVGANFEHLTVIWNSGEVPKLTWMVLPSGGTGANYNFYVRTTPV